MYLLALVSTAYAALIFSWHANITRDALHYLTSYLIFFSGIEDPQIDKSPAPHKLLDTCAVTLCGKGRQQCAHCLT